jgi:hypothetical protein
MPDASSGAVSAHRDRQGFDAVRTADRRREAVRCVCLGLAIAHGPEAKAPGSRQAQSAGIGGDSCAAPAEARCRFGKRLASNVRLHDDAMLRRIVRIV